MKNKKESNNVRFKFNNGKGAIVCNRCDEIIKEPAIEKDINTERCFFCSNIPARL
ncbi:MAG: hypothetical protein ACOC3V_00585 [bacterium]